MGARGSTPMLTATRSVLDFVSAIEVLDFASWADMGRPRQVTVAIEPGDRLNEEG